MFYGKEKNKCKSRSYFVIFEGVLRFGSNFKECIPITLATTIKPVSTEGSKSKTDATLHFVSPGHELWLLPPPGDRDSWISSITFVANKCPYKGNKDGPFRPLPQGLVKTDSGSSGNTNTPPETRKSRSSTNSSSSETIKHGENFEMKKQMVNETLIKMKK